MKKGVTVLSHPRPNNVPPAPFVCRSDFILALFFNLWKTFISYRGRVVENSVEMWKTLCKNVNKYC